MAAVVVPDIRNIPTIFGEIFEKNVTFCVDTSGSMFQVLDVIKEHLIETLLKHSKRPDPTFFNIVEFNTEVTQWSDKMVKCVPQTVEVAAQWINRLSAKTGTNTLDALTTALEDNGCEAVYLVTDGLPDIDHPNDILDQVAASSRGRAIHCIYICREEEMDTAAVEFLEDLAVESYGSFHIVTLTQHGCVEKISPIYRADHAHERIIRTVNGTMHTPTKKCTVGTRLMVDPEETMELAPRVSLLNSYPPSPYPYFNPYLNPAMGHWYMHPYRYYFPNGWSRYHLARGWMKTQESMLNEAETLVTPEAGALLIGKKVLARRIDDGYFYLGTVKSQILADKFLVAFGPCKHGKYKEMTYQDTFIYDLVDYNDALRHTIVTSDKVLAPWEPEGERYGPGVVIEGQEKRQSEGPEDYPITVSLSNGKTVQVPMHKAVWVPLEVYERLVLELQMPKTARETLQNQPSYPSESMPGYPSSGPVADPVEYSQPPPIQMDMDAVNFYETHPMHYPFAPTYPVPIRKRETVQKKTSVKSEEMNKLVPGTNYTQSQLDDKITSQLMEHKLFLDEKQTEKETEGREKTDAEKQVVMEELHSVLKKSETEPEKYRYSEEAEQAREEYFHQLEREHMTIAEEEAMSSRERIRKLELELEREKQREKEKLLKKRQKQEENLLKKSVSFCDDVEVEDLERGSAREAEVRESLQEENVQPQEPSPGEFRYHFAGEDDYEQYLARCEGKNDYYQAYIRQQHDNRYRRNTSPQRPSSAPSHRRVTKRSGRRPPWVKYWGTDPAPDVIDPPSQGPFRETALQTPLEAKDQRQYPEIVEWTSPTFKFVDPQARYNCASSVEQLMKTPKPGQGRYLPQQPKVSRPLTAEAKEEARREFRRSRVVQRQKEWNSRLHQEDRMKELMQDQHRERILAQMEREKQRQQTEQEMIRKSRDAKKQISAELRNKMEEAKRVEKEKKERKIEAMRARRETRDAQHLKQMQDEEALKEQRQQVKMQKSQSRWDDHHKRLNEEVQQNDQRSNQVLNAKINRIEHFRKLEEEGQRKKDLRIGVSAQHLDMYRSQVLP